MPLLFTLFLAVLLQKCQAVNNITLGHEKVVEDLQNPIALVAVNSTHVLLAEHYGRVQLLNIQTNRLKLVLDVKGKIFGPKSPTDERGLLGIAFDPKGNTLYVSYSAGKVHPDTDHQQIVSRFAIPANWKVNLDSEQILLNFSQPTEHHNGGHIFFGCDGYLFVAIGDGGNETTRTLHMFSSSSFLGKMLRLDVTDGSKLYSIPKDNPYENEIYASGFSNPWRCSHDSASSSRKCRIFCGDVGYDDDEEDIVIVEKGKFYKVNYHPDSPCKNLEKCKHQIFPREFKHPIYSYKTNMSAVIGGFYYRRQRIPELNNHYIFADFAKGSVHYLKENANWEFGNIHFSQQDSEEAIHILSLGRDEIGNIYLLTTNNLSEPSGSIYRLVSYGNASSNAKEQYFSSLCALLVLVFIMWRYQSNEQKLFGD